MERIVPLIVKSENWPEGADGIVEKLRAGGVVIFPTETVYGIGSLPNREGVDKLTQLKDRTAAKPLQLLISNLGMLEKYGAKLSPAARKITEKLWPGPLTLVIDVETEQLPDFITHFGNVGFRMPDHPLCLDLIERCGGALAASSANPANLQPGRSCSEALRLFPGHIDAAIDAGNIENTQASTVASVREGDFVIIRKGAVSERTLRKAVDE